MDFDNLVDNLSIVLGIAVVFTGIIAFLWVASGAHSEGMGRVAAARTECIQEGGVWLTTGAGTCVWSLKQCDAQ